MWQDALLTLSTRPGPILAIAAIGIGGGQVLVDLVRASISPNALVMAQAVTTILAQGVIACIALRCASPHSQGQGHHAGGAAAGAIAEQSTRLTPEAPTVLRALPAILLGCLIYSALLTFAHRAVPNGVRALQMWPDATAQGFGAGLDRRVQAFHGFSRSILTTELQTLLPGPDFPLATTLGWVDPVDRRPARPAICSQMDDNSVRINLDRLAEYRSAHCGNAVPTLDIVVAALAVALILATETLLRFRIVAAASDGASGAPPSVFGPIVHSMRLGVRHIGAITAHVWVLRLTILAAQMMFCTAPMLVVQHYILPSVSASLPGGDGISAALRIANAVGAALVSAGLVAFSTVYDARLFLTLSNESVRLY